MSIHPDLAATIGRTALGLLRDAGTRYQARLFNPAFLREKNIPVPDWLAQAFPG